jgi:hypothetical protein
MLLATIQALQAAVQLRRGDRFPGGKISGAGASHRENGDRKKNERDQNDSQRAHGSFMGIRPFRNRQVTEP